MAADHVYLLSCLPVYLWGEVDAVAGDLFGVPLPGHAYWNEETVDAMAAKYPGLDVSPWRAALGGMPPAG